ncbi:ArsA family ATPase [Nesterenkonia sphaerica]|uniref:ArsA family ATPase n=1 Tax=Nesterenkonia sphaerica TaxID=1804988 RepID=A0A5R9A8H5_9MICC|nr:ArsA family ATPase [Nesterenkonia sphaerica]TLP74474.1 ArsA family ATPase [Nesterenkonia sphaerica]
MLLELAADRKVLFIGGKGGVGKTSIASAVGLQQARSGRRVLLVSTDPAHNLGHLWERPVGDEPVLLADDGGSGVLAGLEIDPHATIERHLEQVGQTLRDFMPEHLHKQVDAHLQLARQSPGTHEAAILERIAEVVELAERDYDLIIFDTAPSGHTARLLALPEIMAAWTEGLLNRRTKAEKFGAAIRALDNDDPSSSRGANRDRRIRQVLTQRRNTFEKLRGLVTDPAACSFIIVVNAERVPVLESAELFHELERLGVEVGGVVVNRLSPTDQGEFLAARRTQEEAQLATLRELLPRVAVDTLPMLPADLMGEPAVEQLAQRLR